MRKVSYRLIPHYYNEFNKSISAAIWNIINAINFSWWGVQYGSGIKTIGFVKIRKLPHSSITIENNCTFLSKPTSNLIGINRPCIISTHHKNAKIKIGKNSGFSGTVIGAFKSITIGNNVRCGANTLITDADWHMDDPRSGEPKEVIIGYNVWIGVNSVILKGVKIGENTVIGANSVVVKDIPNNVIAAGNPCKTIRNIKDE